MEKEVHGGVFGTLSVTEDTTDPVNVFCTRSMGAPRLVGTRSDPSYRSESCLGRISKSPVEKLGKFSKIISTQQTPSFYS